MATIGNQTDDGTSRDVSGGMKGISITMPEAGTATSITFRAADTLTGQTWQAGIYDTAGNLLASSATTTSVPSTPSFANTVSITYSLAASTEYLIYVGSTGASGQTLYYSAADTYDGRTAATVFTSPPPATITVVADSARDYRIYLTYTPAGGAFNYVPTLYRYYRMIRG